MDQPDPTDSKHPSPPAGYHQVAWTPDEVRRYWAWRSTQAAHASTYYSQVTGPWVLRWASGLVPLRAKSVVDFGCGPGYLLHALARHGVGKVHGLDFGSEAIGKFQRCDAGHPAFGSAQVIGEAPWPLPERSQDLIIAMEVLEHLNEAQLATTLAEFRRMLKPGGHLLVTTPNEEDLEAMKFACPCCAAVFNIWQHQRSFSASTLSETLENHGFRVCQVQATCFLPPAGTALQSVKNLLKRALGRPIWRPHLACIAESLGGSGTP